MTQSTTISSDQSMVIFGYSITRQPGVVHRIAIAHNSQPDSHFACVLSCHYIEALQLSA